MSGRYRGHDTLRSTQSLTGVPQMRTSLRTPLAAAVVALAVAVAAPAAAMADDAAIKASIPAAFDALAKKERAAASAIAYFNKHKRATSSGRAKVRAVRTAVRNFQTLLSAQQASTPQGDAAKQALLKALDLEAAAATRVDLAMKSANHSSISRTNRIIHRANVTLRKASKAAAAAVRQIAAL
jgi:hypothetical protein